MFTGLVEGKGKVRDILRKGQDLVLTIEPLLPMPDCRIGDSISVSGVCLTVTQIKGTALSMDVSGETLSTTTFSALRQGDEVNLERALRLSDRLGGHLVSGHVDGIGNISRKEKAERSYLLSVEIGADLSRYVIEKGSIAVDGVSLTVNRCGETFFEVNIIPQTGKETTILDKKVGDLVNIETDLIGKYIEKLYKKQETVQDEKKHSNINTEMLIKHGFGE